MKFIVNKEEFVNNLNAADSIIIIKSPLAMLLNVYIEALEDGSIIILSYNGENGVKVETTGVVEKAGKMAILSKKLLEIMRHMPDDKVVLESKEDNENEIIVHPEGKDNPIFNLHGVSADAYPVFNEFNWESYIKIAQETFDEQIISTEFSVSNDNSKPAFTGTYIEEAVEGYLSFVSTDGKKLSVITREYEEKVGEVETGIIIPQKIFKTIHNVLSSGEILFSVNNNQAFFKIGNIYIFTNLVEGKFPNYKDVIPSDKINIALIDSDELLLATETVAVMSDPDSGKINLEITQDSMTISTSHPVYGVAKQELPIKFTGEPLKIAINYRSLADFLRVVTGKKVEMVINSQSSPVLLRSENDDNYTYISMPMKLKD